MEKDNSVKFGSTRCDRCHSPATTVVGDLVLCARHADLHVKSAQETVELRAAPLVLKDAHK